MNLEGLLFCFISSSGYFFFLAVKIQLLFLYQYVKNTTNYIFHQNVLLLTLSYSTSNHVWASLNIPKGINEKGLWVDILNPQQLSVLEIISWKWKSKDEGEILVPIGTETVKYERHRICSAHTERHIILPKLINEFIVVSPQSQNNYFWGDIKNDLRVHMEE